MWCTGVVSKELLHLIHEVPRAVLSSLLMGCVLQVRLLHMPRGIFVCVLPGALFVSAGGVILVATIVIVVVSAVLVRAHPARHWRQGGGGRGKRGPASAM